MTRLERWFLSWPRIIYLRRNIPRDLRPGGHRDEWSPLWYASPLPVARLHRG